MRYCSVYKHVERRDGGPQIGLVRRAHLLVENYNSSDNTVRRRKERGGKNESKQ